MIEAVRSQKLISSSEPFTDHPDDNGSNETVSHTIIRAHRPDDGGSKDF
jgi:hypothetical protein